jgi:hypothetical protein
MKTNEAQEKIYLDEDESWHLTNPNGDSVEYVRTDAFIEKACEFLRTHSEVDYFELIPDANYCGAGNLNKKRMIEDFKNYMKG